MRNSLLLIVTASAAAVGCGEQGDFSYVAVSGVVTVGGEPAEGVLVTFNPRQSGEGIATGGSSIGRTDADGRFTLRSTLPARSPGAVPGPHKVTFRGSGDIPDPDAPEDAIRLPSRYVEEGVLFDVPGDGTSAADFALET
ncbi:MAG: hypothetical protein AAF532_15180 [Planctomycetota bacterium]